MASSKLFRVTLSERRPHDAWVDFSLRQLREGMVEFYKAQDVKSGVWLFKVCHDGGGGKMTVKAVKCPPGRLFAQLEGNSMLFQPSVVDDYLYDVVSVSYVDEAGRTRRRMIKIMDEIPDIIKRKFRLVKYGEAVRKDTPLSDHYVTLTRKGDCKSAVELFILERAWPLLPAGTSDIEFNPFDGENHESKRRGVEDRMLQIIHRLEKAPLTEVEKCLVGKEGMGPEEVSMSIEALARMGRLFYPDPEHVKVQRRTNHPPLST